MKKCIDCGKEEVVARKRCNDCLRIYNSIKTKKSYLRRKEDGTLLRYGVSVCDVCGEPMVMCSKNQRTHQECQKELSICDHDYNKYPRDNHGRSVANGMIRCLFDDFLPSFVVVHHIDGDPYNNEYSNFLLMNRSIHAKLHAFLRNERSAWLKNQVSKDENCWKPLIVQKTTTWLETANVICLKISEIGQSATELLNLLKYEEGSETMYVLSVTDGAVDKDIVQTPTF